MLAVLPRALVAAASGVRAFAREAVSVPPVDVGHTQLSAALREFTSAWGSASCALESAAERCAADLESSAAQYVDVESLLVPAGLR